MSAVRPPSPVRRHLLAAASAALLLPACTLPPRRPEDPSLAASARWAGRLALNIASEPPQSFSAAFELRGAPERGELALFTPIGSTAALLTWAPGSALLRAEGQPPQTFASLDALIEHVTGAAIPVAALFGWLAGRAAEALGWEADLSRHAEGRLAARRTAPPPAAQLRIVLDTSS